MLPTQALCKQKTFFQCTHRQPTHTQAHFYPPKYTLHFFDAEAPLSFCFKFMIEIQLFCIFFFIFCSFWISSFLVSVNDSYRLKRFCCNRKRKKKYFNVLFVAKINKKKKNKTLKTANCPCRMYQQPPRKKKTTTFY